MQDWEEVTVTVHKKCKACKGTGASKRNHACGACAGSGRKAREIDLGTLAVLLTRTDPSGTIASSGTPT